MLTRHKNSNLRNSINRISVLKRGTFLPIYIMRIEARNNIITASARKFCKSITKKLIYDIAFECTLCVPSLSVLYVVCCVTRQYGSLHNVSESLSRIPTIDHTREFSPFRPGWHIKH